VVQKQSPQEVTRGPILATLAAGLLLLATSLEKRTPWLVWNASPSVPLGLYHIEHAPARRGDLVLVRPPLDTAELAHRRGYLPKSARPLKFVSAAVGDRVCRYGTYIFVRGVPMAHALSRDALGRPLPIWRGCRRLVAGELFLLADSAQSFDSRYFGVISAKHVIGRATLICPG